LDIEYIRCLKYWKSGPTFPGHAPATQSPAASDAGAPQVPEYGHERFIICDLADIRDILRAAADIQ
jgi:hypothetical protein